jgi:hypothetical protein
MTVEHEVFVIHNPFAPLRIGDDVFAPYPQLIPHADGTMTWTDGHDDADG